MPTRRIGALKRLKILFSNNPFIHRWPPGHFHSPVPDLGEILSHEKRIFNPEVKELPGIQLNVEGQIRYLEAFGEYQSTMPFEDDATEKLRYGFVNPFFSYGDGIVLYSMMRFFNPKRIIEVGSGYSSALMLDTLDHHGLDTKLTFIEPYPTRLKELLREEDYKKTTLVEEKVQDTSTSIFEELEENDILFIDSSHVTKTGSDVVWLFSQVLPRLKQGTVIHIHDITWPFEYYRDWIVEGRAWNEIYLVHAFLQFNNTFEIIFFNDYLAHHHKDQLQAKLPSFMKSPGGSLWLRKIA